MNKIEAYNQTRHEPKQHVETYKKRFAVWLATDFDKNLDSWNVTDYKNDKKSS